MLTYFYNMQTAKKIIPKWPFNTYILDTPIGIHITHICSAYHYSANCFQKVRLVLYDASMIIELCALSLDTLSKVRTFVCKFKS